MPARLERGDLPPSVPVPPPGPRAALLSDRLRPLEAPGAVPLPPAGLPGLFWEEALGANVLDVDGNLYVDLTAGFGVAAVGHRHPEVVAAIQEQSERLVHGLADVHGHPLRVDLARRLVELSPLREARVLFATSGSDAVEIALKTALLVTGRPGILAFAPAYHGATLGALHATSRAAFRRPFASHFHPHVERLPFGCPPEEVEALLAEGGIGALIVEPMVGREGVLPAPPGWLAELSRLCREAGVVTVADEIFTGFGRAGSWFVSQAEAMEADLLCCGKALGGGMPIAAVLGRSPLLQAWDVPGEAIHTGTFVAHPLACAAALVTLRVLKREGLPERAALLGERIAAAVSGWKGGAVRQVRGRGLLWGVEMTDRKVAAEVAALALARGLLLLAGGPEGRVLQLAPPLVISEGQLDLALSLLSKILRDR